MTDPAYGDVVRAEFAKGSFLTWVPASEGALLALGVTVPQLLDKAALHERALSVGLQVPPSRVFTSRAALMQELDALDYPVVIKPTHRRYPAFLVRSPDELSRSPMGDDAVITQVYLDDPLHAVSGVMWKGKLVAALHERWLRIWPWPCGLASAAESIAPDTALEGRLLRLMEGYDGIFCAQFAGPHLFDLNLRIHSSHPLAVKAGANLVAIYCDLVRGMKVSPVRARRGVFFRWIEGDLLNLISATRGGRLSLGAALKELVPRRGAAHSNETLADPLPTIARLGFAAARVWRKE